MLLVVTFPPLFPAPLARLGFGLATSLVSLARGSDWLYPLVHSRPENGRAWLSSRTEAAF